MTFREKKAQIKDLHVTNTITTPDGTTLTATEVGYLGSVTAGTTAASKALVVAADKSLDTLLLDYLALGGVTASANALVLGMGATATRVTTAVANKNFVEFRTESTATTGDSRGVYNRLYLGGAGVSGESLRSFTSVDDVAANTAHGAHISLGFEATGSVTGLGVAGRHTLHIPDAALTGGTYAALQAEIWADGDSSDISGTTEHSLIRFTVGGDATGAATVTNFASISIPAAMVGSGTLVDTDITSHTAYGGLPVLINGVTKYIALVSD